MKKNVLVIDALCEQNLQALFSDEICVLQLEKYCSADIADQLSDWFLHHHQVMPYHYVQQKKKTVKKIYYGVDRVGLPFNATYNDTEKKSQYYREALPGIRALRQACDPFLSPVDKLRVELDENWPQGANLAAFEEQKMFVGIGRVMKAGHSHLSAVQPHWDAVPSAKLLSQFSANIYLSVPDEGGELEIWPVAPLPTEKIHAQDPKKNWRPILPQSVLVKPAKGDLLLFNTRRPHAISEFTGNTRITVQFFIGLTHEQNLVMWT